MTSRRRLAGISTALAGLALLVLISASIPLASGVTPALTSRPIPVASSGEAALAEAQASLALGQGPAAAPHARTCDQSLLGSPTACNAPGSRASTTPGSPLVGPGWTQGFPSKAPQASQAPSLVYDSFDGYVLYFGGQLNSSEFDNTTWTYSAGVWTNITATAGHAPPGLAASSMAYDPGAGYVLFFGGYKCEWEIGTNCYVPAVNYTYKFSGGTWTNITSTVGKAPSPRWAAGMTWDAADQEVVLFGGWAVIGGSSHETWTFKGGRWANITAAVSGSPSGRGWAAMTYDSQAGYVLLFGGRNLSTSHLFNDTWTFVGDVWTNISSTVGHAPSQRYASMLADDLTDGGLLLYGGWVLGATQLINGNDTWWFDGTWTNITGSVVPDLGGGNTQLAYDCHDGYVLTASGYLANGSAVAGTWHYGVPGGGAVLSATVSPSATSGAGPLTVVFTSGISTCGNPGGAAYTWSFGDHGLASHYADPTHIYNATGTFHVYLNVTYTATSVDVQTNITVTSTPTPLSVVPTSNASTTTVGGKLSFSASATGGSGTGYAYNWEFGDNTTGVGPSITHQFTGQGNGTVFVSVSDSVGHMAHATIPISVHRVVSVTPPAALTVTLVSNASSTKVGGSLTFTAKASGGSGTGYTYWFVFGDNSSSPSTTSNVSTHQFTTQNNGTVYVWVTDSAGHAAHGSVQIQVHLVPSAAAPSSSSSGISTLDLVVIGVVVAAVVVAVLLLMMRRKKSAPAVSTAAGSSAATAPAPAATAPAEPAASPPPPPPEEAASAPSSPTAPPPPPPT